MNKTPDKKQFLFWFLISIPAWAYVDPGAGSYFMQLIIAAIASLSYQFFGQYKKSKKNNKRRIT